LAEQNYNLFEVRFTLATEDNNVLMDGCYYFNTEEGGSVGDFYADRAITGEGTADFMQYYDRALEARCWFEGLGTISYNYQESIKKKIDGEDFSVDYHKVNDGRFAKLGITTLSDLEAYLNTIFTSDIVSSLMSSCSGGGYECSDKWVRFIEKDGAIYVIDAARGGDDFKRDPEYFLRDATEDSVTLVCRVYKYSGSEPSRIDTPLDYKYIFVKRNGSWFCSSFPIIW
jgi:hypothetical protein